MDPRTAQFDQQDFTDNCLAIANDLIVACARANPCGRTPEKNAATVFDEIGPDRVEMVKVGLGICKCCRRHKEECKGEYAMTQVQIAYMVPVDDPACKCMCRVYLDWLTSLQPNLLLLEFPEPPDDWFSADEGMVEAMAESFYLGGDQ